MAVERECSPDKCNDERDDDGNSDKIRKLKTLIIVNNLPCIGKKFTSDLMRHAYLRWRNMNNLADDVLANIIVILTPLEAMSARCTCRTFRCIYDDVHCSLNISTDLETTLLQIRDGGTIQLASDAHIIAKKDIVIRKNIRILGNQNSKSVSPTVHE